jgi:hypothetical protein
MLFEDEKTIDPTNERGFDSIINNLQVLMKHIDGYINGLQYLCNPEVHKWICG